MFSLLRRLWTHLDARSRNDLGAGLMVGLVFGLAFGFGVGLRFGLMAGLEAGLGVGLVVGLMFGLGVCLGALLSFTSFVLLGVAVASFGWVPTLLGAEGILALSESPFLIHRTFKWFQRKAEERASRPKYELESLQTLWEALRDLESGLKLHPESQAHTYTRSLLRELEGMSRRHKAAITARDSASSDIAREGYRSEATRIEEDVRDGISVVSAIQVELTRLSSEEERARLERELSLLPKENFQETLKSLQAETEGLKEVSRTLESEGTLEGEIDALGEAPPIPIRKKRS